MWETAYDVIVPEFPCTIDRFTGDTAGQMFLINHFLYTNSTLLTSTLVPAKDALNTTNAVSGPGSLGQEAETCKTVHDRYPTFLLVDFYSYGEGSVFEVAAKLNGVTYNNKAIAPPNPTGTSTATGAGSTATGRSTSDASEMFGASEGLLVGRLATVVIALVWSFFVI